MFFPSLAVLWAFSIPPSLSAYLGLDRFVPQFISIPGSSLLSSLATSYNSFQSSSAQSFEAACAALASTADVLNVRVKSAVYVANGTKLTITDNHPSCFSDIKDFIVGYDLCRLSLYVPTSNSSGLRLEAWLPRNWSGRFLATGNGGLGGCIQYADLLYGTSLGFATVGANNGHEGMGGLPFLNAPEVKKDFAWRSVHTTAVLGKQITSLFYSTNLTKSYYMGCSTGGRQGLKSAQLWPEDFDGIVAGAPAFDMNNLQSWSGWLALITGLDTSSPDFINREMWALVQKEVIKQCDGIDGAIDGIIEEPSLCRPVFVTLICLQATTCQSCCLTGRQASMVRRVFEPLYGPENELLYPRMVPGCEVEAYPWMYSGTMFPFTVDWFRYVIYDNPEWDPATLSIKDAVYANNLDPFGVSTFDADLSPFRATGGKILTYHGTADSFISPENSARYYYKVADTMSLSPVDLDSFYRYFRISGMGHCTHGTGAWNIGAFQTFDPDLGLDPEDNVLLAMVRWVEEGIAPEHIRGTKYLNDDVTQGVAFRRKHCKFPTRNVYVGPGGHMDEDAWKCLLY